MSYRMKRTTGFLLLVLTALTVTAACDNTAALRDSRIDAPPTAQATATATAAPVTEDASGYARAFYRAWYQPDNALLVVGGRIEPRRALALVVRHFGPLPRPKRALPALYTVEPTQDGERSVTLHRAGDTPIVAALYRAPAGSHPDFPALEVLVEALRVAPQGRLHQALVSKGLASAVWGFERALHTLRSVRQRLIHASSGAHGFAGSSAGC